jgi:CBS domain-containing protein/gamma-glutamylcysteine synthetase
MSTRDHKKLQEAGDSSAHREFMSALLNDINALERMLEENCFESGVRRIGVEQEMFIVDRSWRPTKGILPILERIGDTHYTTELGQFQLEANCDPQLLAGDGIGRMHAQLDHLVDNARRVAQELDMNVVLMGILPTMRKSDLGLDNMVPSARYMAMNKAITELRGGKFRMSIKGLDELIIEHDSVMLEACNSSFQVHLQVGPAEFARMYNIAQVLAGPLMAVSANSPLAFGRRLWAETRVALFRYSVDTRNHERLTRETEARVSFGTRWVKSSVAEIYKEDFARFRTLVGTNLDEDPMAMLDRGEVPQLKALRLHNGTVYRWNRACFGITEGKPHLRIENRIMPSGPSTIDEMANAALWFGMMHELGAREEDVTRRIEFDQAGANFYTAAREGIGAHFEWLDGQHITAQRLVLDQLLPIAESGLARAGVDEGLARKYLAVVEERVRTARTGAAWQSRSWNSLRDRGTKLERSNALVAATLRRQMAARPVAQWERAQLDEAVIEGDACKQVEQFMRTDLFTVHPDDPAEILPNLMIWERLKYVAVEDREHHLLGLVSYREILAMLMAPANKRKKTVGEIMITPENLTTVSNDTPTGEAIQLMRRFQFGCLPVVRDGRLLGLVTETELVAVAGRLMGSDSDAESG